MSKVKAILAEVLELPEDQISADASLETLSQWTSLNHLRLITELESTFGVEVSMDEALALNSLTKLAEKFAD